MNEISNPLTLEKQRQIAADSMTISEPSEVAMTCPRCKEQHSAVTWHQGYGRVLKWVWPGGLLFNDPPCVGSEILEQIDLDQTYNDVQGRY